MMNDLMYRYECFHTGGGRDEDGYMLFRQTYLTTKVYCITKRTEKGVWVVEGQTPDHIICDPKPHFVLNAARKRLCYPTRADALISFMARKKKRMGFLLRDVADLERAVHLAEREFSKYKLSNGD